MKKVIVSILTLCICISLCYPVYASAPSRSPMWLNIATMDTFIDFVNTSGEATGRVTGKSGTTAISGSLTVYKQVGSNWSYIDSDSGTSSTQRLNLCVDFTGESGEYYKVVFDVVVTRNGIDEPESITYFKACP